MHYYSVHQGIVTAIYLGDLIFQGTSLTCWVHRSIGDLTGNVLVVSDKSAGEAMTERFILDKKIHHLMYLQNKSLIANYCYYHAAAAAYILNKIADGGPSVSTLDA